MASNSVSWCYALILASVWGSHLVLLSRLFLLSYSQLTAATALRDAFPCSVPCADRPFSFLRVENISLCVVIGRTPCAYRSPCTDGCVSTVPIVSGDRMRHLSESGQVYRCAGMVWCRVSNSLASFTFIPLRTRLARQPSARLVDESSSSGWAARVSAA